MKVIAGYKDIPIVDYLFTLYGKYIKNRSKIFGS